MAEPKVIKGWLGWAVIGDGLMVYARTRAEALQRYRARLDVAEPGSHERITEDVDDVAVLERPSD